MKFKLTCSDSIQAMEREVITVTADTLDEAWEKAKTKFARKYHTKKAFVDITATERCQPSITFYDAAAIANTMDTSHFSRKGFHS